MLRLLLHSYGEFDRDHPVGPAVWPHFDLLTVHSGRLSLTLQGHPVILRRNESVLIYPQTPLQGKALSRKVVASVQHFSVGGSATLNPVLAGLAGLSAGFEVFSTELGSQLAGDVRRSMALAAGPDFAQVDAVREAQLIIMLGLLRGLNAKRELVTRSNVELVPILDCARQRKGVLSTKALAASVGYSPTQVRRLFRAGLSMAPHRFLLALRINEAKRLLRETRQPLKSIASDLGYSDPVAFHRAFTREAGQTPGQFRRRFAPRG